MSQTSGRNRLGDETSPYLLQHKDNPVHWWAWSPEALAEARSTGKPILLSVGYAACHWCHVMAHESFESEAIAALMNAHFVCIKVDREERPDIDAIYMDALHRLGEHGGWPLTMFLDAQARPFWGGTYFPPEPRYGKPSFPHVLREIARVFREEPEKVARSADGLTEMIGREPQAGPALVLDDALIRGVVSRLAEAIDKEKGGLRGAPKFPQWSIFWLLWRGAIRYADEDARTAVLATLTNICQGGIYDHLGGGFARYSVDDRWLVPHFEKMLYDNALLLDLLTEAWRETHDPLYARRVAETVGWLEREMIVPGGGFAASLDADSEGEEGRFYVWSQQEVLAALGPDDGAFFCSIYDVTAAGNWEGGSILNRLQTPGQMSPEQEDRLASLRARLLDVRARRIRPGWDDKVLADWNGLMIAALARAAVVFGRPAWLDLAANAFRFVVGRLGVAGARPAGSDPGARSGFDKGSDPAGLTPVSAGLTPVSRLLHAYRAGQAKAPATASDYANMVWGALRLYAATAETPYLDQARAWVATLDTQYWHATAGGYCMTADDTPDVIARLRTASDDATPNANTVMLTNLVHLFLLTGETACMTRAEQIWSAFSGDLQRNLVAHTGLLANSLDLIAPQHVAVVHAKAQPAGALAATLAGISMPGALEQIAVVTEGEAETAGLAGKRPRGGEPAAYVCVGTACSLPLTSPSALSAELRRARSVSR